MQATVALQGLQGPLGTALDISRVRATYFCRRKCQIHGQTSLGFSSFDDMDIESY